MNDLVYFNGQKPEPRSSSVVGKKSRCGRQQVYFFLFAAALMLFLTFSSTVVAQTEPLEPSDDEVNAIARQLYCPVCENTPLDVCPTQACAQWRDVIRDKLAQGWTEQQIKDYFVAQYGDRVLAEPPRRGLNWLVYILPLVFFLVGVYIVVQVLRRSIRKPVAAVTADSEINQYTETGDPYIAQLERELEKRKNQNK